MTDWRTGRRVLLGITGGIAAYKTPNLVHRLRKAGCEVEVIMTRAAERFVAPLALSTLSGRRVWREDDFLSNEHGFEIPHVHLADWADVFVIAPCTADTAANLAQGRTDELIGAVMLASQCPTLLFPAMNENMYYHPATRENLKRLSSYGVRVVDPESGPLACGIEGKGRLPEPEEIAEEVFRALAPHDMEGLHVLVTAGPTREFLDPARFISNPSTGRMGLSMARAAWYRGAAVRVVLGPAPAPCPLYELNIIPVVSALDMRDAVMKNLPWANYIVKAAAVGDYRAKDREVRKVKREGWDTVSVELIQNPDIAAEVGQNKAPGQVLIGFAAETNDLMCNARVKMEHKGLDFILANDILAPGSGFASETNTLRLLSRDGREEAFSGAKEDVAWDVWSAIVQSH
ncbi:MAG: bifunctional phosphopantothenoylcysteine decarboxylase/phosphopantothenate--cysteine ligase CoaBC [Synergistaceae bacterium]|nr:bifunctional phosphopantothenoylcysteine decarboxylase/phosphopantothenate--cysteine ligase CoaBC [Synergistaceae bacterium]